MTTYHIIDRRRINSNTAEHGYGDFPEYKSFVACTVEADTLRKAQNAAKRQHPNRFCFGGINANSIYADADLPKYLKEGM